MANPNNLSNELINDIRQDILTESVSRGAKITEQQLCDRYSVSRTPVREALRNLESEGLVELIPNRGAFVVGLSKEDVTDLFQMRKVLESQATRWAVERITKEELEALEENFEFMEYYTPHLDIVKLTDLNSIFHRLIFRASHNRMMIDILSQYRIYLRYSANIAIYREEDLAPIFEEHAAIFQAFKQHDPNLGAQAMQYHMEQSYKRVSSGMDL